MTTNERITKPEDEPVRYSFARSGQTLAVMAANLTGEYVEWVDYNALHRRCAAAERVVHKIEETITQYRKEVKQGGE